MELLEFLKKLTANKQTILLLIDRELTIQIKVINLILLTINSYYLPT